MRACFHDKTQYVSPRRVQRHIGLSIYYHLSTSQSALFSWTDKRERMRMEERSKFVKCVFAPISVSPSNLFASLSLALCIILYLFHPPPCLRASVCMYTYIFHTHVHITNFPVFISWDPSFQLSKKITFYPSPSFEHKNCCCCCLCKNSMSVYSSVPPNRC